MQTKENDPCHPVPKISNAFGFGLYGFVGWVIVPVLISGGYLALRSILPISPGTRLPLDFLGAAVGLGTIGLISTCPLWIIVGAVMGACLFKDNTHPLLYWRVSLFVLLGPSVGFGGLFFLGYIVDALARSLPT